MTTRTRPRRGRTVQPRRSPMLPILLGVVVLFVVALGAVGFMATRQQGAATELTVATSSTDTLDLPTGTTDDGFAYKGSPDAPVTVVEYADFQCPACAMAHAQIEPILDSQYIATGKVRMVYKNFPLQQHPNAMPAAVAGVCALEQNAFWPMHATLFETQDQWSNDADARATFAGLASALELNMDSYNACVAAPATTQAVRASFDSGIAAGVSATPTFFVDGVAADTANLQASIDAALAAKGQ